MWQIATVMTTVGVTMASFAQLSYSTVIKEYTNIQSRQFYSRVDRQDQVTSIDGFGDHEAQHIVLKWLYSVFSCKICLNLIWRTMCRLMAALHSFQLAAIQTSVACADPEGGGRWSGPPE